jgi:hypothetical protein
MDRFKSLGLLQARGRQGTDSTAVLSVVRGLNRVEVVRETMKHALESLAVAAPTWLRAYADPQWVKRYQQHFSDRVPKGKESQRTLAEAISQDATVLLDNIYSGDAPE